MKCPTFFSAWGPSFAFGRNISKSLGVAKDIYFMTQRDECQGFRGIVWLHIPGSQCHTEVTGLQDGVEDLTITAFLSFHGNLDMHNWMQLAEVTTFFWPQESRINYTGHNLKGIYVS